MKKEVTLFFLVFHDGENLWCADLLFK